MRFAFGESELNQDTQELWHRGELMHAEPRVLAVLEYLINHRDRVVTKIVLLGARSRDSGRHPVRVVDRVAPVEHTEGIR